jgi:osmoprotectant transport system substrate-binding protein
MTRARPLLALAAVGALLLAACGSDSGDSGDADTSTTTPQSVAVGSADFPENQVLAEIYAQALEKQGLRVRRQSAAKREVYYKAIDAGTIDLVPEYTNSLLSFVLRQKDPNATPTAKTINE